MTDVFIIGKGPAGISASLYTVRAGFSTVVTGKDAGSLGKADIIENYYGFAEPVSAAKLFENGIKGAERLGVNVISDEVFDISYDGNYTITTNRGTYQAKAVILAAGAARKAPEIKGLKEFEGRGVSYCAMCDAFFHRNKPVTVIGNGEYALNEAEYLRLTSSEVVILTNGKRMKAESDVLENSDHLSDLNSLKILNNLENQKKSEKLKNPDDSADQTGLIDYASQEDDSGIHIRHGSDIEKLVQSDLQEGEIQEREIKAEKKIRVITRKIMKIDGKDTVGSVIFEDGSTLSVSGVFVAEGTASSSDLARKLGVTDQEGKIIVNPDMSTYAPGFFAAGDCTGGIFQIVKAAADGAAAGTAAVRFLRGTLK